MNIEIDFAYKSFKWLNNAKGNAGVTVIIVGLRNISQEKKYLFDINEQKQEVKNINAYLMNAEDVLIEGRSVPISNFPKTTVGNMPADNGYLLFTEVEKNDFIKKEKNSEKFFKELISAKESLNGEKRFCLWLYGI